MKYSIIFLLAFTLFVSCNETKKELSIEQTCAEFDKLDAEMLRLLDEIRAEHQEDKKFLSKFNMEQVYWIQYRDTHLQALYPKDWDRYYRNDFGKEIFNPCKCAEMSRFTEARIAELKLWLSDGPTEQKDCPNIRNID